MTAPHTPWTVTPPLSGLDAWNRPKPSIKQIEAVVRMGLPSDLWAIAKERFLDMNDNRRTA